LSSNLVNFQFRTWFCSSAVTLSTQAVTQQRVVQSMAMLQHSLRPLGELMHPMCGLSRCFRGLAAVQLPSNGQFMRRLYHPDHDYSLPTRPKAPFPVMGFLRFVPEKQACVVERFGRFSRILNPGLNVTVPFVRSSCDMRCKPHIGQP
jgi:hypothetical protein